MHVHIRVSQAVLHWHLTIFKGSSGAGGKSVVGGSSRPRVWSHPHFSGSNLSDFRSTDAIPLRNASFFSGVSIRSGTILGPFSIIYFRGLGLRIRVRVWVGVRVKVRVWVRVRVGVWVRVGVVS